MEVTGLGDSLRAAGDRERRKGIVATPSVVPRSCHDDRQGEGTEMRRDEMVLVFNKGKTS